MGENGFLAHDLRATKKSAGMGYKGREFSYASPKDPWYKKGFIRLMEWVVGRPFLYRMYRKLNDMEATPQNVWGHGLDILDIKVNYDEDQFNDEKRQEGQRSRRVVPNRGDRFEGILTRECNTGIALRK